MRKFSLVALAGIAAAGAAVSGCASDPYYAENGWSRPDPYYDRGYYGPVYRPGYAYDPSAASVAGPTTAASPTTPMARTRTA